MSEGDRYHGVAVEASAGPVNHLQDRRKGWVGGWVGLSEPSVIGRSGRWRNGEDMDAAVAGPVEETSAPVIVSVVANAGATIEDALDQGIVDANQGLRWYEFAIRGMCEAMRVIGEVTTLFDTDDVRPQHMLGMHSSRHCLYVVQRAGLEACDRSGHGEGTVYHERKSL